VKKLNDRLCKKSIENEHKSEYLKAINDKNELFKFIDESIQNSMNLID